ncbi:MAG: radical SAM protein [Chloroflexota bacterium]
MFAAAYVGPDGRLRAAGRQAAVALHGRSIVAIPPGDLIPLPEGSVVSMLPDRTGISAEGELPGAPAAALLPIGYTRTLLPAYERGRATSAGERGRPASRGTTRSGGAAYLPLFGYAAVAIKDGKTYVAAMPTDDPAPWQHQDPGYRRLRRLVRERVDAHAERAGLLRHLAYCALEYECRSAQHVFYGQGEAALPSSPTCNAACVGCISDQPDESIQPHERLSFVPALDESVDLAVQHLEAAPDGIVSFGQGCEGEPLLNRRNAQVVAAIRGRTDRGTININTNGSRPDNLRRLIDAGLGSIRVSMFSAREDVFRRYYKPVRYSLDQVRECLCLASSRGLFTSVNLLTFPGVTDDEDEVAALVDLFRETGVELIQLRNLNIDPEQLFDSFEGVSFRPIGIRAMAARFRSAGLAVGSYTHARPANRAVSDPRHASYGSYASSYVR